MGGISPLSATASAVVADRQRPLCPHPAETQLARRQLPPSARPQDPSRRKDTSSLCLSSSGVARGNHKAGLTELVAVGPLSDVGRDGKRGDSRAVLPGGRSGAAFRKGLCGVTAACPGRARGPGGAAAHLHPCEWTGAATAFVTTREQHASQLSAPVRPMGAPWATHPLGPHLAAPTISSSAGTRTVAQAVEGPSPGRNTCVRWCLGVSRLARRGGVRRNRAPDLGVCRSVR